MLYLKPFFVGNEMTTKWLVGNISRNLAHKMFCGSWVAHKLSVWHVSVSVC